MEDTEIRRPKEATPILRQIETFMFFAAMLLAITLEGACVYWLWLPGTLRAQAGTQASVVGQWTAATLPQCWLLGAVVVLCVPHCCDAHVRQKSRTLTIFCTTGRRLCASGDG